MTTDRDTARIVRSWLSSDEHESADTVLDNVLALLDATPQRRPWWPARRIAAMNNTARLLATVAAAIVIAVISASLIFRSNGNGVGDTPTPSLSPVPSIAGSPSTSPAPTPTDTPSPAATASTFPPDGALPVGRHAMTREGVSLTLAISAPGWSSGSGYFIEKGATNEPDAAAFIFWPGTPDNVFSDPCAMTPASPIPAHTIAALAAAVPTVPGLILVSGPTDTTIGGRPAKHVVVRIPNTLPCAPEQFHLWYDKDSADSARFAQSFGEVLDVWIIDVGGTVVWIDGETYKGAAPARRQELQQIIDSIQFG